jgi:hypothetical protein
MRFTEIEEGSLTAEPLSRVVALDSEDSATTGAELGKDGTFRLKVAAKEIPLPRSHEELRQRVRTLGHCFLITAMKFPGRELFRGLTLKDFEAHTDFMLGRYVAGLESKDAAGRVLHKPDYRQVLVYEHEVRKFAIELCLYGEWADASHSAPLSLQAALRKARMDATIKERFFTTPLQLGTGRGAQQDDHKVEQFTNRRKPATHQGKRQKESHHGFKESAKRMRRNAQDYESPPPQRPGRGGKRQKGNGKGKGKRTDLYSTTPDGRKICFAFNSVYETCSGNCGFVHVCRKCLMPGHTEHMCKQRGHNVQTGEDLDARPSSPASAWGTRSKDPFPPPPTDNRKRGRDVVESSSEDPPPRRRRRSARKSDPEHRGR